MTEAVSLSALATVDALPCPKPLHLGKLPKVGDIGPGNTTDTDDCVIIINTSTLALTHAGITSESILLVTVTVCC
jgi:hypothetical protein